MKRLFVSVFTLFIIFSLFAKNGEKKYDSDFYEPKISDYMDHNWFITLNGGGNVYLGQNNKSMDFADRIGWTGNIAFGKWVVPWLGVRLEIDAWKLKGASFLESGKYVIGEKAGYYKQQWYAGSPHVDAMFNMGSLFGGYSPKRIYEPVIYAGVGFITDKSFDNISQSTHFGLINKFYLSYHWDLNLNAQFVWMNNDFDGKTGSRGDIIGGVTLGLTYKFKKQGYTSYANETSNTFKPVEKVIVERTDSAELISLQEQLDALNSENSKLRNKVNTLNTRIETLKKMNDTKDTMDSFVKFYPYNVVVGSFENKEKALTLQVNLEKEGYNPIIAQNEKGMYRVIIAGYDSERLAYDMCKELRSKYPKRFGDAWILINK